MLNANHRSPRLSSQEAIPCSVCAMPDEEGFILCETCDAGGGHFGCLGLEVSVCGGFSQRASSRRGMRIPAPLSTSQAVPEGDWFCAACVTAGKDKEKAEADAAEAAAAKPTPTKGKKGNAKAAAAASDDDEAAESSGEEYNSGGEDDSGEEFAAGRRRTSRGGAKARGQSGAPHFTAPYRTANMNTPTSRPSIKCKGSLLRLWTADLLRAVLPRFHPQVTPKKSSAPKARRTRGSKAAKAAAASASEDDGNESDSAGGAGPGPDPADREALLAAARASAAEAKARLADTTDPSALRAECERLLDENAELRADLAVAQAAATGGGGKKAKAAPVKRANAAKRRRAASDGEDDEEAGSDSDGRKKKAKTAAKPKAAAAKKAPGGGGRKERRLRRRRNS